jgi:putative ABC transport system permease protein
VSIPSSRFGPIENVPVEIASDLRFALRIAARQPTVPLLVAGLFALGVGLASGMWAVVDAAILRPLPYHAGGKLVAVMETHPQRGRMAVTPANFLDWAHRVTSLQDVAGTYAIVVSVAGAGTPARVSGTKVTERFFELWAVPPALGRVLQASDFAARHRVAVLGHALWQRQFGGDPRVIGASVRIDGEAYTAIGVMPGNFRTVGNAQVWIPWIMSAEEQRERRFHLVGTVARLRDGRSIAEAGSELATIYQQLAADYPDATGRWRPLVLPLRDLLLGDSARALMVLGGAVLVLVVVAWINVAGLLLAWLPSRRQELLVRMALGATMARVLQQLLLEAVVWAAVGLGAGLAIARSFVGLFGAVGVSTVLPYDFDPRVDGRVILTTAALLLISVAATAIGPSLIAVRRSKDLVPRRGLATGRLGSRVAVVMQVALSIVLLSAAAGLLVGFRHLAAIAAPAADAGQTLAMEISRPESHESDDADNRRFFERVLLAIGERREIRGVAAASYVPPTRPLGNVRFAIEGRATSTETQTALASAVSATAFELLNVPLVRGRLIEPRDLQNGLSVAVVSTTLSRRYWPNENPIGQRVALVGTDTPITIVGVVGDVKQPLSQDPRAESVLYLSFEQFPWPFMTLMFVPAADAGAAVAAVRQEVTRIDSSQATGPIEALADLRNEWLGQPRLQTRVVTLFGVATLLLTVVGLYARVAHAVSVRARELAIRQALGARPTDVVRELTLEALFVTAGGVAVGLCLLPVATRALRNLVIDAPTLDVRLAAAVACLLVIIASGSAYWPARRAGRIDPAELLRTE